MKYLLSVISFVLIVSAWPVCAAEPVRIMTYNIRYDNPEDSLNNWKYRRDFVVSMIRYHQPQIWGIQEGLSNQVHDLSSALPDFDWVGVGRDDGKTAGEYSALFFDRSRFDKLDNGNFWLSETPDKPSKGWDAACIRIVTWAKLRDKQDKIIFFAFNTHFDHIGVVARRESASLILNRIHQICKNDPVLLTGDFNSSTQDTAYQILTQNSGLTDSYKISKLPHHGPDNTYSGFLVKDGIIGDRIDFIFVSPTVRVLKHATLTDFKPDLRFPSDHLPVIADVEIR